MQVSDTFRNVLSATMAAVLLIAAVLFVAECISPPAQVLAQNGGTVGVQTLSVPVFHNQGTSTTSGGKWQCNASPCSVLPDNGQASNYLSYCTTNFVGTISLEWLPPGETVYVTVALATYQAGNADTVCSHTLQAGGYYPNLRVRLTVLAGTLSAWYTSSAAPISFVASAISSVGPVSPVFCDKSTFVSGASGAQTSLAIAPVNAGDTLVICGFTVSFSAATANGTVALTWYGTSNCTSAGNSSWAQLTTVGTPQTISISTPQQSNVSTQQQPCLNNASGSPAYLSVNYASVRR